MVEKKKDTKKKAPARKPAAKSGRRNRPQKCAPATAADARGEGPAPECARSGARETPSGPRTPGDRVRTCAVVGATRRAQADRDAGRGGSGQDRRTRTQGSAVPQRNTTPAGVRVADRCPSTAGSPARVHETSSGAEYDVVEPVDLDRFEAGDSVTPQELAEAARAGRGPVRSWAAESWKKALDRFGATSSRSPRGPGSTAAGGTCEVLTTSS